MKPVTSLMPMRFWFPDRRQERPYPTPDCGCPPDVLFVPSLVPWMPHGDWVPEYTIIRHQPHWCRWRIAGARALQFAYGSAAGVYARGGTVNKTTRGGDHVDPS